MYLVIFYVFFNCYCFSGRKDCESDSVIIQVLISEWLKFAGSSNKKKWLDNYRRQKPIKLSLLCFVFSLSVALVLF